MATLIKSRFKIFTFSLVASGLSLMACTKSLPYKTVAKDQVVTKSTIDTNADYLYIPSTGSISKGQSPSIPYFLTGQKVVRLQFTEKSLRAYEVPTDPALRQNQKNYKLVLEIPVDHFDYRCSTDRIGQCKNEEEENKDISWSQKSKFKPDFSKVAFGDVNLMPESYVKYFQSTNCMIEAGSQVTDYKIDETSIQFQIEKSFNMSPNCADASKAQSLSNLSSTVNTSYTLIKLSAISTSDYQALVYPSAAKNKFGFFKTSLQSADADSEERTKGHTDYVNRWNPNRETVTYILSESFNKPQFADLKKSTYAVFDNINQSLKEAHSNLKFEIKEFSQQDSTDLRVNQIILAEDFSSQITAYSPIVVNPLTGEILKGRIVFYADSLKSQAQNIYKRYLFSLEQAKMDKIKREVQSNEMITSFESYLATQNSCLFNSDIGTMNRTLVAKISKIAGSNPKPWEDLSQDEMQNVLNLLMPEIYSQLLVHEMGHNLGLRHNFAGSFDNHSSVMDYSFDFGKSSSQFGIYDVAALKFAYSAQESEVGIKAKAETSTMKYCTDEHLGLDPSCQAEDEGTTLVDSAKSLIAKYKFYHATASVKGKRQNFSLYQDLNYAKSVDKMFLRLRSYQERYEKVKYENNLADNDESWTKNPAQKDLKDAALLVGNFFLDIIETADRTCIIGDKKSPSEPPVKVLLQKLEPHATHCNQVKLKEDRILVGQYGDAFLPIETQGEESSSDYLIEKRGLWIDKVLASKYFFTRVLSDQSTNNNLTKYFDKYTDNFFDHSELQVRAVQLVADLTTDNHEAEQIAISTSGEYSASKLPVIATDFNIPKHIDSNLSQFLKTPDRITSLVEVIGLQILKQSQDEPYANQNARKLLDYFGVYKTPAVAGAIQARKKSVTLNGITWGFADAKINPIASALVSQIKSLQAQKAKDGNVQINLQDLEYQLKQLPVLN